MQERQFERLGVLHDSHDARVICATHRNLVEMVDKREFRADLFYRSACSRLNCRAARSSRRYPLVGPPFCEGLCCSHAQEITGHFRSIHDCSCTAFMAGQRPGIANSIERSVILSPVRVEWLVARTHWHIEVIRACDAGRSGALAHPSDSPANRRCGRRSGWRSSEGWASPDDIDRQDEAAGYRSRGRLSVAGASSVGSMSEDPLFRMPPLGNLLTGLQVQETSNRSLTLGGYSPWSMPKESTFRKLLR